MKKVIDHIRIVLCDPHLIAVIALLIILCAIGATMVAEDLQRMKAQENQERR